MGRPEKRPARKSKARFVKAYKRKRNEWNSGSSFSVQSLHHFAVAKEDHCETPGQVCLSTAGSVESMY